jgi:phage I-like protein
MIGSCCVNVTLARSGSSGHALNVSLKSEKLSVFSPISFGAEGALPDSVRLFKFGSNPTAKGEFFLSPEDAAECLRAFNASGVDLMFDLEHDSVDDNVPLFRADARDARGWFGLEVRDDGLYAVGVTWTPDGARRLTEKTQRYVSPYFKHDAQNHVRAIVNAALCARPATHDAPALVAASRNASHALSVQTRAAFYLARHNAKAR